MSTLNESGYLTPERAENEKRITKLAVMAVYDQDQKVIALLEKLGVVGEEALLARAKQHPDFRMRVLLAKQYEREAKKNGVASMEVTRALEKLGITDGRIIMGLAAVKPLENPFPSDDAS